MVKKSTVKRKRMTMVVTLGIAVVMLFAIVALSACNLENLTLRGEVDAIGAQVYYFQNGGEVSTANLDALLVQIDTLKVRVAELEAENAELIAELVELRQDVQNMRSGVFSQTTLSSCERFSLTVNINKTRASIGESIYISVVFKNMTEEDIEIEVSDHIAMWYGDYLRQDYLEHLIEINILPECEIIQHPLVPSIYSPFTVTKLYAGIVIERTENIVLRNQNSRHIGINENYNHRIWIAVRFFNFDKALFAYDPIEFYNEHHRQEHTAVGFGPISLYTTHTTSKGGHN